MIIFKGTKTVGVNSFLVFTNETGALVDVPVDAQTQHRFVHYFGLLSPGVKDVEDKKTEGSESS